MRHSAEGNHHRMNLLLAYWLYFFVWKLLGKLTAVYYNLLGGLFYSASIFPVSDR